jgi:Family of unknown function (DUF6364)
MTTKLTLSISAAVVKKAKQVARRQKTSVSKMVETYLEKTGRHPVKNSVTETILQNAPAQKTKPGAEKNILRKKLSVKYDY